jgi:hypothetical protein
LFWIRLCDRDLVIFGSGELWHLLRRLLVAHLEEVRVYILSM